MNHIVALDPEAKEIENLVKGIKSMIIYGADEMSDPYGKVSEGDIIYFVYCNDNTLVKAKGIVSYVYNSCSLCEEESYEMIIRNQDKLLLPDDIFYRWAGKRYLMLVGISGVEEVKPFTIRKNNLLCSNGWCHETGIKFEIPINRQTA